MDERKEDKMMTTMTIETMTIETFEPDLNDGDENIVVQFSAVMTRKEFASIKTDKWECQATIQMEEQEE